MPGVTRRAFAVILMIAASAGSGEGTPLSPCDGLADRWQRIQQDYLDRLGDAGLDDAGRIEPAGAWLAQALLEQVRDAESLGCEQIFRPGSPELCARLDELTDRGPAGRRALAALTQSCEPDG